MFTFYKCGAVVWAGSLGRMGRRVIQQELILAIYLFSLKMSVSIVELIVILGEEKKSGDGGNHL